MAELPKPKPITLNPIIAVLVLIITFFAGFAGSQLGGFPKNTTTPNTNTETQTPSVDRVIDGDSNQLTGSKTLRYVGMSTPEKNEKYYEEAKEFNRRLVEGKMVRLEFDKYVSDRFGRELAYVWVMPDPDINILTTPNQDGEINVSIELVRQGLAKVVIYEKRAKLLYQDELLEAEKQAKTEKLGIWSK